MPGDYSRNTQWRILTGGAGAAAGVRRTDSPDTLATDGTDLTNARVMAVRSGRAESAGTTGDPDDRAKHSTSVSGSYSEISEHSPPTAISSSEATRHVMMAMKRVIGALRGCFTCINNGAGERFVLSPAKKDPAVDVGTTGPGRGLISGDGP